MLGDRDMPRYQRSCVRYTKKTRSQSPNRLHLVYSIISQSVLAASELTTTSASHYSYWQSHQLVLCFCYFFVILPFSLLLLRSSGEPQPRI